MSPLSANWGSRLASRKLVYRAVSREGARARECEGEARRAGIRRPVDFQILGYRFVPTYQKGDKGKYQLVVADKGWIRLKQNLKAITRKTTPSTFEERIEQLKEVQRG